jgi:ABC-type nitrate/sulfonate/bicarbonate transport system substrate-binding protein
MPLLVGNFRGIYRRYGIDLRYQAGLAPSIQLSEVQSGELSFYTVPSEAAPVPSLRTFMVYEDRDPWVMVAPDSIRSVRELAGKTIVGQTATSLPNLLADQILNRNGVRSSDVSVVNVPGGADQSRLALVQAGKAAATVVQYTAYLSLPAGYHAIYNASEFVNADEGLVTTTAFARAHPALMRKMVAATAAAVTFYTGHEKASLPYIEHQLDLSAAKAAKLWQFMREDFITGRPSAKVISAALSQDRVTLSRTSSLPQSRIFDFSYLPAKA